jgi:hypothetical protein
MTGWKTGQIHKREWLFATVGWSAAVTIIPLIAAPLLLGPLPAPDYVFVLDTDRRVGFIRNRLEHIGTLDARGGFHETETYDPHQTGPNINKLVDGEWIPVDISAPRANLTYTGPALELRGELLFAGAINADGVFIALPNSAPTPFRDYQFRPGATRIWNLPGEFIRLDHLDARRKWLAQNAGSNPKLLAEKARLDAAWATVNPPTSN